MKSLSKILNYLILLAIIALGVSYYNAQQSKKKEFQDLTIKITERDKKVDQVVNKYLKQGSNQNEINQIKVENTLAHARQKLIEDHGLENTIQNDVDLISIIENSLTKVLAQSQKSITINREFEKIPVIQCDKKRIEQAIENLLIYHVQAVGNEGEIWLVAKLIKGNEKEPGMIKIITQNNGVGIDQDVANKLFSPTFYSSELGINVVRMLRNAHTTIVEHKGILSINSKKEQGTEITFLIPLTQF